MSAGVRIIRLDHTASELRALAAKSLDGAEVRRLLALALVLEGHRRAAAAALTGMDRQTLRDWVHRYNAEGVSGLCSIRSGGHPTALSTAQMSELKALVIEVPAPEKNKVVRWRCVDLRDEVARRFDVTVTERTVGKWLPVQHHEATRRPPLQRDQGGCRCMTQRRDTLGQRARIDDVPGGGQQYRQAGASMAVAARISMP